MTKIEKAVRIVSDLYDFYRHIPKITSQNLVREGQNSQAFEPTPREPVLSSSESDLARHR
jgi:hypothetical protein